MMNITCFNSDLIKLLWDLKEVTVSVYTGSKEIFHLTILKLKEIGVEKDSRTTSGYPMKQGTTSGVQLFFTTKIYKTPNNTPINENKYTSL